MRRNQDKSVFFSTDDCARTTEACNYYLQVLFNAIIDYTQAVEASRNVQLQRLQQLSGLEIKGGSIENGYDYGSMYREVVLGKSVYAFARPGGTKFLWYSAIVQELIERGTCAVPTAPVVTGDTKTNLTVLLQ